MSEINKVFIATPCFGGQVTQGYMQSIISLMHYLGQPHTDLNPTTLTLAMLGNDALITRSRNTLVSSFLNSTDASHLLFIDADISFDPEQVARLILADKDVIGALYPIKALDWELAQLRLPHSQETDEEAAFNYVGTPLSEGEAKWDGDFVSASYAGTGMLLIKRHVIQAMIANYPDLQYNAIHSFPRETRTPETQYALFDCLIDDVTGLYLSEDYAFCQRWRLLGGEVWLDTASRLTHTGPYSFKGNSAPRFQALREAKTLNLKRA